GSNQHHMDDLREQLKKAGLPDDDEHCVIHAMFPAQLATHYANKNKPKAEAAPAPAKVAPVTAATPTPVAASAGHAKQYALTIDGRRLEVQVEEI
ncbi:MAG: pyruvate carboxylase subunit B, partial [Puniceicoccales bacterium]